VICRVWFSDKVARFAIALERVLPYLCLILGLLILYWPTWSTGFSRVQGDLGDTRFNNYLLEHSYKSLVLGERSIWSPPFFWPTEEVLAYSDALFGGAFPYWTTRILGFQPDTAFQLWMILISSLNFALMYTLLRKELSFGTLAASGGAYFFAFAASRSSQLVHQQLHIAFFIPALSMCLMRLEKVEEGKVTLWALLFGFCLCLQFYSSFYLTWFLCFFAVFFITVALTISHTRIQLVRMVSQRWGMIVLGGIVAVLCALPLVIRYVHAANEVGVRNFSEVLLPRLASWIAFSPDNTFFAWTRHLDWARPLLHESENFLGIGFVSPLVVGFGCFHLVAHTWGRVLVIASGLMFLCAVNFDGFTLWRYVYALIPGAEVIRAVGRIGIFLLFPLSIALAAGLHRLRRISPFVSMLLLSIILLEQTAVTPSFSKAQNRSLIEKYSLTLLRSPCESFALIVRNGNLPEWKYQIDAMWISDKAGIPTVNGYSGKSPKNWKIPINHKKISYPSPSLKYWESSHSIAPCLLIADTPFPLVILPPTP
jgi:hypothetical protein